MGKSDGGSLEPSIRRILLLLELLLILAVALRWQRPVVANGTAASITAS